MWTLNKPSLTEAKNDIDNAFPNKVSVTIKKTEKDELKLIYDHYDNNNGVPHDKYKQSNIISDIKINTIKNAYNRTQNGKNLCYIRVDLLKNAKQKCVLCGQNERLTLDHYLPESVYKLVAINRQNLVPTCFICNNLKNDKPAADFIHAYYDCIPSSQFLIVKTQIQGQALNVRLEIDANVFAGGVSNPIYKKCIKQIQYIKLEDRINEVLSGFLAQTFMNNGDIIEDQVLKKTIILFIKNHERLYGVNDWRTAILRALEQDENFTTAFLKLYMQTNNEDIYP